MKSSAEGPLSGYRIIDLSRVLSGPPATILLADQGTELIKVESLRGDFTSNMGSGRGRMTIGFPSINHGKRGRSRTPRPSFHPGQGFFGRYQMLARVSATDVQARRLAMRSNPTLRPRQLR